MLVKEIYEALWSEVAIPGSNYQLDVEELEGTGFPYETLEELNLFRETDAISRDGQLAVIAKYKKLKAEGDAKRIKYYKKAVGALTSVLGAISDFEEFNKTFEKKLCKRTSMNLLKTGGGDWIFRLWNDSGDELQLLIGKASDKHENFTIGRNYRCRGLGCAELREVVQAACIGLRLSIENDEIRSDIGTFIALYRKIIIATIEAAELINPKFMVQAREMRKKYVKHSQLCALNDIKGMPPVRALISRKEDTYEKVY